ncbi:MAG: hypothetical protein HRU12_20570 [Phaeodactylibacter sp.]|nr:hypothetical protein [Phaeodactylibacter sp.]
MKYILKSGEVLDFTGRYKIDTEGNYYKYVRDWEKGLQGSWILSKKGYHFAMLSTVKGGKQYSVSAHRAVKSTFDPAEWFEGSQVDHIDKDKSNNKNNNTRWLSPKDNVQRSIAKGGFVYKGGERYDYTCQASFCRKHDLHMGSFNEMVNGGRYKSCGGFTVEEAIECPKGMHLKTYRKSS